MRNKIRFEIDGIKFVLKPSFGRWFWSCDSLGEESQDFPTAHEAQQDAINHATRGAHV